MQAGLNRMGCQVVEWACEVRLFNQDAVLPLTEYHLKSVIFWSEGIWYQKYLEASPGFWNTFGPFPLLLVVTLWISNLPADVNRLSKEKRILLHQL